MIVCILLSAVLAINYLSLAVYCLGTPQLVPLSWTMIVCAAFAMLGGLIIYGDLF